MFSPNAGKCGPEKLGIRTLYTQCRRWTATFSLTIPQTTTARGSASNLIWQWSKVTINYKKESVWVKVFKNGPSKICERQRLKNFTWSILEYLYPYDAIDRYLMHFFKNRETITGLGKLQCIRTDQLESFFPDNACFVKNLNLKNLNIRFCYSGISMLMCKFEQLINNFLSLIHVRNVVIAVR